MSVLVPSALMPPRVMRLLAAHACTATALGLAWPGMLEQVWHSSDSALLLGIAGALRMAPYVLVSGLAGRMADRLPRGWLIRQTVLVRAALAMLTAALLAAGHPLAAVLAASLMVAAGTPAYPAAAAGMPALAGPACPIATRLLVTIEVSAFVVGPAAGGALLAVTSTAAIAVGAAVLTLAGGALMVGLRLPRPEQGPGEPAAAAPSGRACRQVLRSDPAAARAVLSVVGVNAVYGALSVLLVPLAAGRWAGDAGAYPTLTSALGVGGLLAPLAMPLLAARAGGRAVVRAMLLTALPLAMVAGSGVLVVTAVLLAASGIGSVSVEAIATGTVQDRVPDRLRASILGLLDSWMVAAAMLTAGITPLLAEVVDPGVVLAVLAGGLLVLARTERTGPSRRALRRARRDAERDLPPGVRVIDLSTLPRQPERVDRQRRVVSGS